MCKPTMEKLWQKESSQSSAVYVNIFKGVQKSLKPITVTALPAKSNAAAANYRATGNQLFGQGRWLAAIEQYNHCLCHAEPGSDQISYGYANRATCFLRLGRYANCLTDIGLAIEANYPEHLMAKLEARRVDCLRQKAMHAEKAALTPALSYAPNENFPYMANVLTVRHSREHGLHLVATEKIPVGKTVIIDPGFLTIARVKPAASFCDACQLTGSCLMPCTGCTGAMFCSVDCAERGRGYHGKMCGYGLDTDAPYERMILQSIAKAVAVHADNVDELMAFVESVRGRSGTAPTEMKQPKDEYGIFVQLKGGLYPSKGDNTAAWNFADRAFKIAMNLPEYARLFDTLRRQRFMQHLTFMQALIATKPRHCHKNEMTGVLWMGVAGAMLRPHCYPNVMRTFGDRHEVCVTIRPIEKGDQLLVAYIEDPEKSVRHHIFAEFGYWCECSKCVPVADSSDVTAIEADMECRKMLHHIQRGDLDGDASARRAIQEMCRKSLDKYGHLPHNKWLEVFMRAYEKSIHAEFGSDYCRERMIESFMANNKYVSVLRVKK